MFWSHSLPTRLKGVQRTSNISVVFTNAYKSNISIGFWGFTVKIPKTWCDIGEKHFSESLLISRKFRNYCGIRRNSWKCLGKCLAKRASFAESLSFWEKKPTFFRISVEIPVRNENFGLWCSQNRRAIKIGKLYLFFEKMVFFVVEKRSRDKLSFIVINMYFPKSFLYERTGLETSSRLCHTC